MKNSGFTIWFTGKPGSGKTTLSRLIGTELQSRGLKVEVLDGEELRKEFDKDLGFSKKDRDAHIRRMGFICQLLNRNGITAIAAAVSPYQETRDHNRQVIDKFVEVYIRCPLEVLKTRDSKGLYQKALRNEIENFTGISDPYEEPLNPEVIVESDKESPEESTARVIQKLEELGYLAKTSEAESPYTKEEEEKINERLTALGYM